MEDILNIGAVPESDDSITKYEYRTHHPYASSTLDNSDEIRIPVQCQDGYTHPSKSYLYVEGTLLTEEDNRAPTKFTLCRNGIAHLFQEIRYELNGILIDSVRNPGITTTMKAYASVKSVRGLEMSGWTEFDMPPKNPILSLDTGHFSACVPLSFLLGFAEDYRNIIINAKQELILIRSRSDENAIIPLDVNNVGAETVKLKVTKLTWKLPHVTVSDVRKAELLNYLEKGLNVNLSFRSWDLYTLPQIPQNTQKYSWTIKTTTSMERPRHVIVGFQTDRNNNKLLDSSLFDHCKLTNIKLYLNNEVFPYDDLGLDFDKKRVTVLYDMYARFQNSYYGREIAKPFLGFTRFTNMATIVVIDCSNQSEPVKSLAPVAVRLDFESKDNFPEKTSAHCLIISEQIYHYNPFTSSVNKFA